MLIEIIIGVKSLSAHRAEIPMLALVHSQVIPQVGPGGKHLVAVLACQDLARHLQQPILDRLWMPSGAVALDILPFLFGEPNNLILLFFRFPGGNEHGFCSWRALAALSGITV